MIRHRFIVAPEDFRIFAAIPSEAKLLTWKRWEHPPAWSALRAMMKEAAEAFQELHSSWSDMSDGFMKLSKVRIPSLDDIDPSDKEKDARRLQASFSVDTRIISGTCKEIADGLNRGLTGEDGGDFQQVVKDFTAVVKSHMDGDVGHDIEHLRAHVVRMHKYYENQIRKGFSTQNLKFLSPAEIKDSNEIMGVMYEAYDKMLAVLMLIILCRESLTRLFDLSKGLANPELPGNLVCPEGVPFAAYTIESGDVVINVVEGLAWIENRQESDAEKRVAEIVSQMLTERSLNPLAETRIPVRAVDPKHETQQRRANERAPQRAHTVKFHVTPPRYLREAAEQILTSSRRAHWVIGHWRNQPWGEGHALRRQTWISPHIRGLGEAGASTARVLAPRESTTTKEKT